MMLTRANWLHVTLGLVVAALVGGLFHVMGVASVGAGANHSLFRMVGGQWSAAGGDYAHAWMMPLISVWAIWWKRRELCAAEKRVSWAGLGVLVAALVLHWMAYRAQQPRISLVAFSGVLWAVPFFVYGWRVAKLLAFPAGYLLLCFSSYALVYLTFNLRLMTSTCAAFILNGLMIQSTRIGTAIYSAAGGGFNFDVADACSGLRSLVVMTALAAPYAYLTQPTVGRKWLLFVLSVPMAVVANVVRIVTIALVAEGMGPEMAMRLYHDFSGYMLFVTAIVLMTGTGRLLQRHAPTEVETVVAGAGTAGPAAPPDLAPEAGSDGGSGGPALPITGTMRKAYLTVIVLLAAVWGTLALTGRVRIDDAAPLAEALPARVGAYRGVEFLFCQSDQCGRGFRRDDLAEAVVCPACGCGLDTMALAEKRVLPADTSVLRKQYTNDRGEAFTVAVVISGVSRQSIHPPQVCLVAQGFSITAETVMPVALGRREALAVKRLNISRAGAAGGGEAQYAYWFVSRQRETPYHLQRLLWTGWDGVVHGVHRRWAYVSVSADRPGRSGEGAEGLKRFIAELYPLIKPGA